MKRPHLPLSVVVAVSSLAGGIECGEDLGPGPGPARHQIGDLAYVERRFFFLVDPVDPLLTGQLLGLDQGGMPPPAITGLRIWWDDRNPANNAGAVPGVACLDPTRAAPDSVPAWFDPLLEEEDYTLRTDLFTVVIGSRLHRYAVLELLTPIGSNEVLAATFTAAYRTPEGQDLVVRYGSAGAPDTVRAKALYVPEGVFTLFDDGGQFYSRADSWYPVRRLELRNIYSLGARDIDGATLQLAVKRKEGLDPLHFPGHAGATYLRGLGVDKVDRFGGPHPDDRIDDAFVKPAEGLVVLPDLRPFAPASEDSVWPFFRADLLAIPPGRPAFFTGEHADRAPYDKRRSQVNPSLDGKYVLEVSF